MKRNIILLTLLPLFVGCGNHSTSDTSSVESYIQNLEVENNISYAEIVNTRGSYITSMCYTKTMDETTNRVFNPCYSCHTKGEIPNYYNDSNLQVEYNFPAEVMTNPFTNLFKGTCKPLRVSVSVSYFSFLLSDLDPNLIERGSQDSLAFHPISSGQIIQLRSEKTLGGL